MGIASLYAGLVEDPRIRRRILGILSAEFERTERAILAVTGQRRLLAREPVLLRSVELRNPYIDPLNYIQVEMMRRLRGPGQLDAPGGRRHSLGDRAHDQRDQRGPQEHGLMPPPFGVARGRTGPPRWRFGGNPTK